MKTTRTTSALSMLKDYGGDLMAWSTARSRSRGRRTDGQRVGDIVESSGGARRLPGRAASVSVELLTNRKRGERKPKEGEKYVDLSVLI